MKKLITLIVLVFLCNTIVSHAQCITFPNGGIFNGKSGDPLNDPTGSIVGISNSEKKYYITIERTGSFKMQNLQLFVNQLKIEEKYYFKAKKNDPIGISGYSLPSDLGIETIKITLHDFLGIKVCTYTYTINLSTPIPTGIPVELNKQLGDFNGDGKTDLLYWGDGIVAVALAPNQGNKFGTRLPWIMAKCGIEKNWLVGDFNHDGKDDIMGTFTNEGAKVFLSDGKSFLPGKIWTGAGNGTKGWYVGDFNGDHFDDIFRVQGQSGAEVFLSDGTKFASAVSWTSTLPGDGGWQVGDFDGDGKDDILRMAVGVEVLISTGAAFKSPVTWAYHTYGLEQYWVVGKFNKDKSDDILRTKLSSGYNIDVALSNAASFGMISTWGKAELTNAIPIGFVGDFNGDGLSDILKMGTGAQYLGKYLLFTSNGSSFNLPIVMEQ